MNDLARHMYTLPSHHLIITYQHHQPLTGDGSHRSPTSQASQLFVQSGLLLLRVEEQKTAAGGARSMTIVLRGSSKCSSSGDPTIARGRARARVLLPIAKSLFTCATRSRWLTILLGCYAVGLTVHLAARSGSGVSQQLLSVDHQRAAGRGWWPSSSGAAGAADDFRNPSLAQGPMTVVAISQSRTSSTVAFNLARILLERLDPATVSGWEDDILGLYDTETKTRQTKMVHEAVGPAHEGGVVMSCWNEWPARDRIRPTYP